MTINKCATGSSGLCRDNEQKFIEPMKCERFHEDTNGPWYMIGQATGHEKCGEVVVQWRVKHLFGIQYSINLGFTGYIPVDGGQDAARVS